MANLLSPRTRDQLLALARAAAQVAYCPYSIFRVGAAVLSGGQFFTGSNIENASFGLTVCAERAAIFRAVTSGERALRAIAVSCPDAPTDDSAVSRMPCGACRQVMAEFASPELIVFVDGVGDFALHEILPEAFRLENNRRLGTATSAATQIRPRLCIDIDNVIAETDVLMRKIICEYTDGRVNLRAADITDFDYRNCVDPHGQRLRRGDAERGIADEWDAVHNIFSQRVQEIAPYPRIQQTLSDLTATFELHLATSRLYTSRAGTIAWLVQHDFPKEIRLHFLRSGEKHLSLGQFFAAVEDELSQAERFAHAGIHSLLRAQPWNSRGANTLLHRFESWEEITAGLRTLAGFIP